MESTINYFPNSEKLRKSLRIPLGFTVSPASSQHSDSNECFFRISLSNSTDVTNKKSSGLSANMKLFICSKCRAYLSPSCVTNGAIWNCGICGTKNQGDKDDTFLQLTKRSNIEIISNVSNNNNNINLNRLSLGQVYAIYLSLDFGDSPIDFAKAKISAFSIIRHMPKNSKCIIIIGSDSSEFSILLPPQNSIETTTLLVNSIKTEDCIAKYGCASVVKFASIQSLIGLDLTKFFFTCETSAPAELAIDKLTSSTDSNPHCKVLNFARILSTFVSPLRVIAIIKEITRRPADTEPILRALIRTDFLLSSLTPKAAEFAKSIPGTVSVISGHNAAAQAKLLVEQETRYQVLSTCHAKNATAKWEKPTRPYTDVQNNTIFAPIIVSTVHPFSFELTPTTYDGFGEVNNKVNDKESNETYCNAFNLMNVQVVTKYFSVTSDENETNEVKFITRIQNKTIKLVNKFEDFASSVNWNNVLYFWAKKLIGLQHEEAITALLRVTSVVVNQIISHQSSHGEVVNSDKTANIDKTVSFSFDGVDMNFLRGVCAFYLIKAFRNKEDEKDFYGSNNYNNNHSNDNDNDNSNNNEELAFEGTNFLLFAPPDMVRMVPLVSESEGNIVCQSANGVSESRGTANKVSKSARSLQMMLPVYMPIQSPVDHEMMRTSSVYLALIAKLVKEYE